MFIHSSELSATANEALCSVLDADFEGSRKEFLLVGEQKVSRPTPPPLTPVGVYRPSSHCEEQLQLCTRSDTVLLQAELIVQLSITMNQLLLIHWDTCRGDRYKTIRAHMPSPSNAIDVHSASYTTCLTQVLGG